MPAEPAAPHLQWNLARDVGELLEYHFMVNALLGAGAVAVMAGAVGWVMVVRRETFAGHTLAMMAFPGASCAALAGIPAAWGYFAFCGAGALAISSSADRPRAWDERSANTAAVQALALAVGFLFVSLYGGVLGDLESLLFGSLLGISDGQLLVLGLVAAAVLSALCALARPLLFASVDSDVASARGVRVRALSVTFLVVLGLAIAATAQITGALLVFALLVAPAASAQELTCRPVTSLVMTVVIALAVAWIGLGVSYFSPYPAGFFISALAFAAYAIARLLASVRVLRSPARAVGDAASSSASMRRV